MSVAVPARVQPRHAPPHPAHSRPIAQTLSPTPSQNPTAKMPPRTIAGRPVAVASRPTPASSSAAPAPKPGNGRSPSASVSTSNAPSSSAPSSRRSSTATTAATSPVASSSSSATPMPPPSGTGGVRGASIAALPVAGKDTSSSTGRIFAKPSKEWVLPERAKPGRKAATDEPENRRQSQNRLSQRAHRARRTDYIQTLEERLRKYEADEIHSNVRLQEVARALKQDNERLKNEINQLRATVTSVQSERDKWNAERQTMAESIRTLQRQLQAATLNNSRNSAPLADSRSPHEYEYGPSPVLTPALTPRGATPRNNVPTPRAALAPSATTVNSTLACPICPDPDPDCPCQRTVEPVLGPARIEPTLGMNTLGLSRCGLCDMSPEACLCRPTVEEEIDVKPDISSPVPATMDMTDCGLCTSESFCACRAAAAASSSNVFADSFSLSVQIPSSPPVPSKAVPLKSKAASMTLSGPLSATPTSAAPTATVAAPAVALKLRRRPAAKQSVWTLDNVPAGTSRAEAVCTGDPSNCDACRNDSFGREFCENLFGVPHKKCSGCGPNGCGSSVSIQNLVHPPTPVQQPLVLACCGAPELCGHAGGCAGEVLIGPTADDTSRNSKVDDVDDTMRPEEAWRALKAHPNSKFTPLAILADVVARRSKVVGPRVELSPEPEGRCEKTGTTGAKRRLAVETSAVREALQYLDTHGGDGEREAKRPRV